MVMCIGGPKHVRDQGDGGEDSGLLEKKAQCAPELSNNDHVKKGFAIPGLLKKSEYRCMS